MNVQGVGHSAATTQSPATLSSSPNAIGKQPVGLEDPDNKQASFAPIEESAQLSSTFNRASTLDDKNTPLSAGDSDGERKFNADSELLTEQQQAELRALKARDIEVRAHERAHASTGGQFAGAPTYQFARGPDGQRYAVGGEVAVALPSFPNNPKATLRAAEQVRAAALAPAQPSAQDLRIASAAAALALDARTQLVVQKQEEQAATKPTDSASENEKNAKAGDSNENAVAETAVPRETELSPKQRNPFTDVATFGATEPGRVINDVI